MQSVIQAQNRPGRTKDRESKLSSRVSVTFRKRVSARTLVSIALAWVLLALGPASAARVLSTQDCAIPFSQAGADATSVSFDRIAQKVRVDGSLGRDLRFSFQLPPGWRESAHSAHEVTLNSARVRRAMIRVTARSAADLPKIQDRDVVSGIASALQAEHEAGLGKPAQSVSLQPLPALGAVRWTATWIDENFNNASHSFTTEAFLVELSEDWVLSLTFVNVGGAPVIDALANTVLPTLEVRRGRNCTRESSRH